MMRIVTVINSYSERVNHTEIVKNKPDSPHHRKWHATNIPELYRCLGILLFIGLRRKPKCHETNAKAIGLDLNGNPELYKGGWEPRAL